MVEESDKIIIANNMAGYDSNLVFHITQYEITIDNACAVDETKTINNITFWKYKNNLTDLTYTIARGAQAKEYDISSWLSDAMLERVDPTTCSDFTPN